MKNEKKFNFVFSPWKVYSHYQCKRLQESISGIISSP